MNEIEAVTYAENREAFFASALCKAERQLDWAVKHNPDCYVCAEKGEAVAYYQDALAALREQAEREKGCEYCLQGEDLAYGLDSMQRTGRIYIDGNLLTSDLYSESMAVAVCFCPVCGKRLEVEQDV